MVQPSQPQQSTKEMNHILEIEWELAVLGAFLAISHKNSGMQQQLSKMQDEIQSGASPKTLTASINLFIDELNSVLEGAPLPIFELTGPENARRAIENYIVSFERFLNFAMEHELLPLKDESTLFNKAMQIWDGVLSGQPSLQQSLSELQSVIQKVNTLLPTQHQFPNLPSKLYDGGKI